jgi:predicted PurR-regulated permease PerM
VTKVSVAPGWQRALIVLTGTVVGVVVVSCLYWAQRVVVPVALAVFLTFLLTPLVGFLQRWDLRRMPAVVLVALLAALGLGGIVWLVTAEVRGLVAELPTYTKNIKEKVKSLRQMGHGAERLDKMIQDITGEWNSPSASPEEAVADKPPGPAGTAPARPSAVVPQADSPAWLSRLPAFLSPAVELLGGLALALVLVVFMLLKRESLRDRLIRLVGQGRMTVTTKALDDAGQRISRFLLMQFIINGSFGLVLTIGLLLIQVPHALLWGCLAAILRYVPYLGSWILAAILRYVPYLGSWMMASVLIVLSLGIFPGWFQPLLVVGLIGVLEVVTANVAEPRLFGHSMGVSEVALLVTAAFWAFLWGPIGLRIRRRAVRTMTEVRRPFVHGQLPPREAGHAPTVPTSLLQSPKMPRSAVQGFLLFLPEAKTWHAAGSPWTRTRRSPPWPTAPTR